MKRYVIQGGTPLKGEVKVSDARLTPTFADAAEMLKAQVRPGDLVIAMGCGDIYKLNDMLRKETSE